QPPGGSEWLHELKFDGYRMHARFDGGVVRLLTRTGIGRGRTFYDRPCALKVEGIVSKRVDAPYAPGNRGLWLKVKCLNREEFVVVGWTDPEGARPWLGALLLAYYDPYGRLVYAGRAGTGIDYAELERLWLRLQPLAISKMPLDMPPPRDSRFGS